MRKILLPFMALAAVGFACSLVVHVLALAGRIPPGGDGVFSLHMGIFVIWIPVVLVSMRLNQGRRGFAGWKQMLVGCPAWMRYAAITLFVYAFANFFLAMRGVHASPEHADGPSPQMLRSFSGHWMLFYGLGFSVLLSAFRKPWLLRAAKCAAGHKVAHSDRFCPACGVAISDPSA